MSNDVAKIAKNEGGCFAPKAARAGMAAVLALGLMPTAAFAATYGKTFDLTASASVDYDSKAQNVEVTVFQATDSNSAPRYNRTVTLTNADNDTSYGKATIDGTDSGESDWSKVEGGYTAKVTINSTAVNAGSYEIVINQDGSLTSSEGDATPFVIEDHELTASDIALEANSFLYTGKQIKPEVKVCDGSTFVAGTDYDVTYGANVEGQGTVTVRPKGTNLTGDPITVTFDITNVVDEATAFANGVVTAAVDQDGKAVEVSEDGTVEFTYNGKVQYAVPTELTLEDGTKVDLTDEEKYVVTVADKTSEDVKAGYQVSIQSTDGKLSNNSFTYNIAAASLKGAFAYNDDDMADDAFVYNTVDQEADVNFGLGEEPLAKGTDIDVNYFKLVDGKWTAQSEVKDAGEYLAILTGKANSNYAGSTENVKFTVEAADLSDIVINVADQAYQAGTQLTPKYNWAATASKTVDLMDEGVVAQITSGQFIISGKGEYTVKLMPSDTCTNYKNSAEVSFSVVDDVIPADNFKYDGQKISDQLPMSFDNSVKGNEFDLDKISVIGTDNKTALDEEDYTVTVTKDGKEVSSFTEPGEYKVTVALNHGDKFELGGQYSFGFKVYDGSIETTKVFVNYNGKIVSSVESTYDGTDVMDDVKITVKANDTKVLTEGKDYEIKLAKKDGTVVDSIVDQGDYVVTVSGIAYSGTETFEVAVNPIEIAAYRIVPTGVCDVDETTPAFAETGSAVVPTIQYTTDKDADEVVWTNLPTDLYELVVKNDKGEVVENAVEAGSYYLNVKIDDEKGNYDGTAAEMNNLKFVITKVVSPYTDVNMTEWYAQSVYSAWANDYMKGTEVAGRKFVFLPNNDITRAEVAAVVANMAKAEGAKDVDNRFEDVNDTDWYGEVVTWAANTGIMNGYGNGVFGAKDKITREQFACTLYNYAKAMGNDVTVKDAEATLAKYSDADTVSDWATTAVAWAVENGIMGNGGYLDGQATITRAEVAAMAVNYQPEAL